MPVSVSYEPSQFFTFFNRFFSIKAVLQGVAVTFRCAASFGAAMHPTSPLSANRRRLAWLSSPRFCATADARLHRRDIPIVAAGHFILLCAGPYAPGSYR